MFESNHELIKWVSPYLPRGAVIQVSGKQAVLQSRDLDGDGINEVFGIFAYNQQHYLFVLKNYLGSFFYYFPIPPEVEKRAMQELDASYEMRAVYLFPAPIKEIGASKWGFIDAKGRFVLPAIYDFAGDFQDNGLAIVGLTDKLGLIDTRGYFIVKPRYDTINPFSEGRAIVNDLQGFKVIDESGNEVTEKAYSLIVGEYKEGRVRVVEADEHGQYLYGYLNRRGKEVISITFDSASEFTQGRAVVKRRDGSYALIDLTGKVLKTFPYAFVGDYGQGLLAYKEVSAGKFGYLDEQGNTVIKPQFTNAAPFIDGHAIVSLSVNNRERYGVINRHGQFIIKPHYNDILYLEEERYAIGKEILPQQSCIKSIYALADTNGHILTGFIFNEITNFQDGLASVSDDQHTFMIDKLGKKMDHLPIVNGSGRLSFEKTLIKGEIDHRLLYFNHSSELIWKQSSVIPLNKQYSVVEHKYKPNKDYLVYYPQIEGMQRPSNANNTLKELAGVKAVPSHTQLESNYTGDFEVTFYKKNLLVIQINGYDYPFCAAHGMPIRKYAHINLKSGSLYQLKDLFKHGSPYIKVLSEWISDQIHNNDQYFYFFPDEYHGIKAEQPFFISETGLNIYFLPYEIAAFAAGFPTFEIPFEEIKDILNVNGEFWNSFH